MLSLPCRWIVGSRARKEVIIFKPASPLLSAEEKADVSKMLVLMPREAANSHYP